MKADRQTVQFTGRVIRVTTDEVVLPNGHRALLEVVHHPGGAATVALDDAQRVCLLRQYRYVADGWLWELPAGKLEPAEPPLATAQRELAEEAGRECAALAHARYGAQLPGGIQRAAAPVPGNRPHPRRDRARGLRAHRGPLDRPGAGL